MERSQCLTERRRYPRFEVPLALMCECGATKSMLRTVDVSLGGIRIQTDRLIPVDERLHLIILLQNEVIKPLGTVVRSRQSSNRKYDVGISFEATLHQSHGRLKRFLDGIAQGKGAADRGNDLDHSSLRRLQWKSFELDRLRLNFLKWLHRSYPWDYARYAYRFEIGENEVRDFMRNKGIDQYSVHYLLKSLRGG